MKRVLALLCAAMLLGGCVAVPYDSETVYYPAYPTTFSAQISSGYHYPDYHRHSYPYISPPYSRPYPYYQPPAYIPPAPVIVPPPIQPGWQHRHPDPRRDVYRGGPRPDWNRPGTPHSQWRQGDQRPGRQRHEGNSYEWRGGSHEWRGDRQQQWQRDGSRDGRRGNFDQR